MSVEKLKEILEMLRYYNAVEITHTFKNGENPLLSVCCLKNTSTFQITILDSKTVKYFECVEEAAKTIEKLIH
ncbi:hypothetical protein [Bacillus badius]|uniref:Uncharacterized protein n=1 Tax=Bacillus badius TaxID=1455 RepID=A0ABR5AZ33_BACBA|nr:hypothetical protein [Bacillus badius]KIL75017.1 hypothetical protein SD78_2086 [Bacillus badius]KIL80000.1 hypothetical protein SD77_2454 [Bacillus badius]KZR60148.1 hypothetical protein A3781_08105 [Bacillus badius]MED4717961.1 hypothetical protein [Bacillus badius]